MAVFHEYVYVIFDLRSLAGRPS